MRILIALLFLLAATKTFCQSDNNGNPVFNSVTVKIDTIRDFQFYSNYYTLKNNIENKTSSVYISEKPGLDEIENAATRLPSNFFIIMKRQSIINMVMLRDVPERQFFVINPASGEQREFECSLTGDITENRANEIINEGYDAKAKIEGNKLFFNNKKFKIISNEDIEKGVLNLIEKRGLSTGSDTANLKMLTKEELQKIVVDESREGGKLDFFTEIKGHEMDGIQIKPGLFSTKIGIALYKWGRANYELGTNTVEDALEFWSVFKGRPANIREKEYIKLGFEKGLEK